MAFEAFQSFSRVTAPLPGACPTPLSTGSVRTSSMSYLRAPGLGNGKFCNSFVYGTETQKTAASIAVRAIPRMIYRGGLFYIWGGLAAAATNAFNSYDPATDSYASVTQTSTPAARYLHEAAIYNDEMYIFAGLSGGAINTMYKYNFTSQAWSLVTPSSGTTPTARYGMGGDVVGNLWYLHGGTDGTTPKNDFYTFNFDTLAWTTLTSSGFTAALSSVVAQGNGIYVIGGENGNATTWYNTVKYYDLLTSSWSTPAVLLGTRSRMSSWACDDGIHCMGGFSAAATAATTHYFYAPAQNMWYSLSPLGSSYMEGATGYVNSAIWTFGGVTGAGTRQANMRKYT